VSDDTAVATPEPTEEEVAKALERLRKQKAYRQEYQEKRAEKLKADPALAAHDEERRKKYFEEHKEEIYAKRKAYYETHKEQVKQYHKNYHDKNKAVMNVLRERAKAAGMKLEQYLESIA
jgi:hypothetical protein